MNPLLMTDGYKVDHRSQYPKGTELIYSNFTPRKTRIEGIDEIVFFGLQYFVKDYLIKQWNEEFFNRDKEEVVNEYREIIEEYLGKDAITYDHVEYLHDLGYLPIIIKAVPEGHKGRINEPLLTIYNTDPKCFWLTNFLETILSAELWKPCTSATIALQFRKVFDQYADETCDDRSFVKFQGHDFSFRGMSGSKDAIVSGAAHLLSFVGTDTIPAIPFLKKYYSGEGLIGCSVSATEHSVVSAGQQDGEFETFKRLITEVYPKGILSLVSDTWDFWAVVTDFLPRLKDIIVKRSEQEGINKVVIRPDSGDPVKIICGDSSMESVAEQKGLIECLWDIFGGTINSKGYKVLHPCCGGIFGDGITLEIQKQILEGLKNKGFASSNLVFGIGSYTYQFCTRDTFGFVMKATYCEINGKPYNIFKSPKTGGWKKSHKGLMCVADTLKEECSWAEEERGILQPVFENGKLVREQTLQQIRNMVPATQTYVKVG